MFSVLHLFFCCFFYFLSFSRTSGHGHPTDRVSPPWQYLQRASEPSLQSYELTRLNHAANLRKEIAVLVDEWIESKAYALLARWLLEHWAELRLPNLLEQPPNPQGDLFAESAFALRAKKDLEADAAD